MGDLLTLTGTNYAAGEAQVTVNFGSIPIAVPPDSDTQISVTVPPGAISGPVTVTTTAMVNGQPLVQTSNPEDILVIWKDFDLTPILTNAQGYCTGYVNNLFPGTEDDLYVEICQGWPCSSCSMLRLKADGTVGAPPGLSFGDSSCAMDPADNSWIYMTYSYNQSCLEDPARARSLCWCSMPGTCWSVAGAGFDGAGNLYVEAYTWAGGPEVTGIWRFGPDEPLSLDPSSPDCLTPSLLPLDPDESFLTDFAVSSDGTVFSIVWLDNDPDGAPPHVLKIPPGQPYELLPLPTVPNEWSQDSWTLATDCMGRGYAYNTEYYTDPDITVGPVFSVETGMPLADSAGLANDFEHFTSDGYGDLYLTALTPDNRHVIHRITPNEMTDHHYYDNFTCCPTGVQYKDVVQKSRGEIVPLSCSTLAVTISQTGSQPVQVTQSGETVTLPLGATPTLTVTSNGQPVSATWSLQNGCRTNGPDPDDLFPNDVVILFPPNGTAGAGLAAMHVGSVQITATSTSGQNSLSFTVKTVASGPLGSAHSEVDPSIYAAAEQFGIPPQYIKAMIEDESSFTATAYRYEPRTWDFGASQPGFRLQLGDPAFAPFAFQEPSMTGVPGSPVAEGPLTPSWKDMRLDARYSFKLLPSFAVWNQGQGCTAVTAADDDLSAYALSLGTSAWSAVVPAGSPYKYCPCGEGENWFEPVSVWEYDEYRAGQCFSVSSAALDFFYDNPYNAQTILAASYGYMQVGFEAIKKLGWLNQAAPNPKDLETADTNIGLGSHWLAQKRKRKKMPRYYGGTGQANLSDFQDYFIWLCTLYNGSEESSGSVYGTKIVRTLAPPYQPQIPAP